MILVSTHVQGNAKVGRITFDRPEKKNALTPTMIQRAIEAAAGFAADQGIGAIVLDGNGAALCAGFDLTLCKDDSAVLGELLVALSRLAQTLRRAPAPVVIAAHGAALAGGCAIVASGDVVISHHDAKIGYPVVKLGISPAVSAPMLSASVSRGAARALLLNPSVISGWKAHQLGLVHDCLEDAGKVRDRALGVALGLALKPPAAMIATKRLLNDLDRTLDDTDAARALEASMDLVGNVEQQQRLAALWSK